MLSPCAQLFIVPQDVMQIKSLTAVVRSVSCFCQLEIVQHQFDWLWIPSKSMQTNEGLKLYVDLIMEQQNPAHLYTMNLFKL